VYVAYLDNDGITFMYGSCGFDLDALCLHGIVMHAALM